MSLFIKFGRILRFVGAYAVANLQAAMEYRVSFWMQVLTMIANNGIWLFFWWSYFHAFPLVNGWQNTDIVVIWAVTAAGYGVSMGFLGNAYRISTLITKGGLDAYLGMPRYVLLHVCVSASNPTAWGDILFSIGTFAFVLRPDPLHIVIFVVVALSGALIFTSFIVIFGSLAFFLGNTEGLAQQLLGTLVTFSTYPMNIFSGATRLLLFTVIPAGFISFIPLQLLHQFTWPLLLSLFGFTVVFVAVAAGLFQ